MTTQEEREAMLEGQRQRRSRPHLLVAPTYTVRFNHLGIFLRVGMYNTCFSCQGELVGTFVKARGMCDGCFVPQNKTPCQDIDPEHVENRCLLDKDHVTDHKDDFGNTWVHTSDSEIQMTGLEFKDDKGIIRNPKVLLQGVWFRCIECDEELEGDYRQALGLCETCTKEIQEIEQALPLSDKLCTETVSGISSVNNGEIGPTNLPRRKHYTPQDAAERDCGSLTEVCNGTKVEVDFAAAEKEGLAKAFGERGVSDLVRQRAARWVERAREQKRFLFRERTWHRLAVSGPPVLAAGTVSMVVFAPGHVLFGAILMFFVSLLLSFRGRLTEDRLGSERFDSALHIAEVYHGLVIQMDETGDTGRAFRESQEIESTREDSVRTIYPKSHVTNHTETGSLPAKELS